MIWCLVVCVGFLVWWFGALILFFRCLGNLVGLWFGLLDVLLLSFWVFAL